MTTHSCRALPKVLRLFRSPAPYPNNVASKFAVATTGFVKLDIVLIPSVGMPLGRWSLPLGLIVHPLSEADGEVPTVSLGSAGIVRCKRCRTYINPFVRWVDGGRCGNLCRDCRLTRQRDQGG